MGKTLTVITICCSMWVSGASATDFTAERVVVKNGHSVRATLYCRGDMWRIEHNTYGPIDVTIVRKDKGVMWFCLSLFASLNANLVLFLTPNNTQSPLLAGTKKSRSRLARYKSFRRGTKFQRIGGLVLGWSWPGPVHRRVHRATPRCLLFYPLSFSLFEIQQSSSSMRA